MRRPTWATSRSTIWTITWSGTWTTANWPVHYLSGGDFYLVIPRYDGMALALSRSDIETLQSTLIYEDPDCRPFLLQCNASDIFADRRHPP